MKKRALSALLAIALLLGMLPMGILSVGAYSGTDIAYAVEGGNIYFDKETGKITDCDVSVTAADIPAEIDGVAVTSIGNSAFYSCDNLESVTIPDSVTSIEDYAFYCCDSLENVSIPDSVTSIGASAFCGCYSLTSITIPDSVTSIGDSAFCECVSLGSVTIPDSVTSIGKSAFSSCISLTSVTIPDSVTYIGYEAFYSCVSLESVTIPDSVTSIGAFAFSYCESLCHVLYTGTEDQWNGISISSGNSYLTAAFRHNEANGDEVTTCKTCCGQIAYCSICEECICYHLVEENTHNFTEDICTVCGVPKYLEYSISTTGEVTITGCDSSIVSAIIPSTVEGLPVTSIGDEAFSDCYSLTSVTIGNGVTSIGSSAFKDCKSLTSVTIPASVTSIGSYAFYECINLSAVCFMGDAPTIGSLVFAAYIDEFAGNQPIPGLTLYYIEGAEGWTTPTWNGYSTAVWDPNAPEDPEDPPVVFDDVSEDAWYASAVEYAVENGLFNGMSENTFEPETAMTRAMLVTVLWRYAGEPMEGENTFTDVPAGQWYTDAVAWAAHNNIVGGVGDNKFDPNGNITREQMATILYRYASGQGIDTSARADLSGFPDAGSVSSYANDPICWAVAEGLVNGSDGKLMPQGNATRAQVATILMRFIENVVK